MDNPQKYIKGIAQAILETYREVIAPLWQHKSTPIGPVNNILANKVIETVPASSVRYLAFEYKHWDRQHY
jgi:hypothetical protein